MKRVGRESLPHEPPLYVPDRAVFFITLCANDRASSPLVQGPRAGQLLDAVRFYHETAKWWCHVAVVMPDHMHLLVSFPDDMHSTVSAWKRWTKRVIAAPWQRDFFDHRIRHDESFAEKADYVLQNPVRAGLVERVEDWPYRWVAGDSVGSGD